MIGAFIFDMDGLLVDSEPLWDEARRQMAQRLGQEWNRTDHLAIMGVSTAEWTGYMLRRWHLDMTPEQVQAEVLERLHALYLREIPFLPGAVEAVGLAARTAPTAVASGSPPHLLSTVTADPRLNGKFQAVVSADDVKAGKPAPDVYLEAARRLKVAPQDCVCLEDSANGIRAGKAAGMRVIAVPDARFPQNPEVLALADVVLPSLHDFTPDLIGRLSEGTRDTAL